MTAVTFTVVNTKPDFTITTVLLNEPEPSVIQGDDLDFEYIVANLGGSASHTGSIFYNFNTKPDLSHRTGPIRGRIWRRVDRRSSAIASARRG